MSMPQVGHEGASPLIANLPVAGIDWGIDWGFVEGAAGSVPPTVVLSFR